MHTYINFINVDFKINLGVQSKVVQRFRLRFMIYLFIFESLSSSLLRNQICRKAKINENPKQLRLKYSSISINVLR